MKVFSSSTKSTALALAARGRAAAFFRSGLTGHKELFARGAGHRSAMDGDRGGIVRMQAARTKIAWATLSILKK